MKNLGFLGLFLMIFSSASWAQDATYKIEFISNWGPITHPVDFPSGAHWSSLIGTTHQDVSPIFEFGVVASDGVEQVAETGGIVLISQEINLLIAGGLAYEIISGPGLATGLGTITKDNVGVDIDFPYISLLTMIAPSPDWIAQINNVKLTDASNNWLPFISIDVYATDAGTDNGSTYLSPDSDTNPRALISSLEGDPPFSNQIVGTFVLTLETVLAVRDELNPNNINIYPNPSDGEISIKNFTNTSIDQLDIYASNGQKVKTFQNLEDQKTLDLGSLNGGLYILNLKTADGSYYKKLIIR